jgi:hypothetical protein
VQTLQYFKEKLSFFAHKKLKNNPQKLLVETQIHFFFLAAQTAQTAQTE